MPQPPIPPSQRNLTTRLAREREHHTSSFEWFTLEQNGRHGDLAAFDLALQITTHSLRIATLIASQRMVIPGSVRSPRFRQTDVRRASWNGCELLEQHQHPTPLGQEQPHCCLVVSCPVPSCSTLSCPVLYTAPSLSLMLLLLTVGWDLILLLCARPPSALLLLAACCVCCLHRCLLLGLLCSSLPSRRACFAC